MSELLQALSFVYRRKGATSLTPMEFKHCVSLDLRWFAPADAKRLLEHALRTGLVQEDGDQVRAAFDPRAVEVPVTFKPTLAILDEPAPANVPPPAPAAAGVAPGGVGGVPPGDGAPVPAASSGEGGPLPPASGPAPLMEAAEASGETLETLIREADSERKARGRLVSPQVAALVVARRRGVDVRPHLEGAYAAVRDS